MKSLLQIALTILSLSLIYSEAPYKEIEYRQRIVSKYDKSFTLFSVKFVKDQGIEARYQKGKLKYVMDPATFTFVEKTSNAGLKIFKLTSEELTLPSVNELFENFDKINFPEETNFNNALYPDFPIWHLIVDGKDYQSNVNTEFYDKVNELVNIKYIQDYVIKKYNN